jgi:hypothetical protein
MTPSAFRDLADEQARKLSAKLGAIEETDEGQLDRYLIAFFFERGDHAEFTLVRGKLARRVFSGRQVARVHR